MSNVSLDTQIIIALLSDNTSGHRTPGEWQAIRSIAADVDAGAVVLTLPTIAFAEILPSRHGGNVGAIVRRLTRRAVDVRDLTSAIASRAAELRDSGRMSGRRLKTVDAIFIATAEAAGCDCLYSSDPDVYRATGSKIPLVRPGAADISFLPGTALAA